MPTRTPAAAFATLCPISYALPGRAQSGERNTRGHGVRLTTVYPLGPGGKVAFSK
jgi:hypothetical protein